MLTTNSAPATGAVSRTYRVITDMLNREKCGWTHSYSMRGLPPTNGSARRSVRYTIA